MSLPSLLSVECDNDLLTMELWYKSIGDDNALNLIKRVKELETTVAAFEDDEETESSKFEDRLISCKDIAEEMQSYIYTGPDKISKKVLEKLDVFLDKIEAV